ncbi:MAG: carboxypeptidase-like regulatory domain-containing protein [Planctomycetota bacterium]
MSPIVKATSAMRLAGLLGVIAISSAGCSKQPANTGIVRFDDGQPVQSGSIEFRNRSNGDAFASRVAPDGNFALADKDGQPSFPPGDYEVVVVQIVLTEDLAADEHQHGRTVPRRYADYYTSGLRFTNDANRSEPIRIELESN